MTTPASLARPVDGPKADAGDLFFDTLVADYVERNRFVRRAWLASRVEQKLNEAGTRFVLITAEPGAGKSAFLAQLARDHPEWLRYFIRRDQRSVLSDVADKSLLLRLGYQLAALRPTLFTTDALRVSVAQQIGAVVNEGEVIGAEIKRLVASPFYQKLLEVEQHVQANAGKVVGLRVQELVVEPRLLSAEDLFYLALRHPASALDRTDPEKQIVVLIDALDEIRYHQDTDNILDWLTNCPQLPRNIRFVLSSRPPDDALNLFREQHADQLAELTIDEDDPHVTGDVRQFVSALVAEPAVAEALRATNAHSDEFARALTDKARGNLGYAGAVARGIDAAIRQGDAATLEALVTQEDLPAELEGLYAFFLHRIKASPSVTRERIELTDPQTGETYDKPVWPAFYDRVLGVLAVAMEPLDLDQLLRLGSIQTDRVWASNALERLRQFLDVVGGRYRLYHATVAEFLTADITHNSADTTDLFQDARRRHRQIADLYWSQRDNWDKCDDYGLRNLAAHLYQGQLFDRLSDLVCDAWMGARVVREGYRYSGFLSDVNLASQHAATEAERQAREDDQAFAAFATCFRYALIRGSINSLSGNYPPPLVQRALETSLWPVERALDVAARVPDPWDRARSYVAVLTSGTPLTDTQRKEVCRATLESLKAVDTQSRAEVLHEVVSRFDEGQLRDALAVARATPGAQDRADSLLVVARQLAGDERTAALDEALAAVRTSSKSGPRAQTLAALAGLLSEPGTGILDEALASATATTDPRRRAQALTRVAGATVNGEAKTAALRGATAAARAIDSEQYRVEALAGVAAKLDGEDKAVLLAEALAMARAIHDPDDRAWALWECMTTLEEVARAGVVEEVRGAARSITEDRDRASLLIALARYATGEAKAAVLNEALAAAWSIDDTWDQTRARRGLADRVLMLTAISAQLTGEQKLSAVRGAMSSVLASKELGPRVRALARLASQLTGPHLSAIVEEALTAARAINDSVDRVRALAGLVSQLSDDSRAHVIQEALAVATVIDEGFSRAWAILEILPLLTAGQLNDVLVATRTIEAAGPRAAILVQLVDRWTADEMTAILPETLAAVRAVDDPKIRAASLAYLTYYLAPEDRMAVLGESVATARALASVPDRVEVNTMILRNLSGKEKADLQGETLAAARSIEDDEIRLRTLAGLISVLSEDALVEVRKSVAAGLQSLESKSRERALTILLQLPALLSDEDRATVATAALAEVPSVADERQRAELLTALVPYLHDEKSVSAATAAALALGDKRRRLDVLLALRSTPDRPGCSGDIRLGVVDFLCNGTARSSKAEVLDTLGANTIKELSLGAETVVSTAGHVIDIDKQWRWL